MTSKDTDKDYLMLLKSDTIVVMINDIADEITEERFKSPFFRYQIALETSMKCVVI